MGQTPPETATPGRWPPAITLEGLLYCIILALALLTRFWDLGSRALHHDESLHAYYSWMLATGQGYHHDPLTHGPFLFHFNALIYMLFGASDITTRFTSAIFGVILVMQPIMLRGERQLRRWGALTASTLLLISPAFLYQARYIRHDSFTVVGALLLLTAIVRYIERPSRGWLVTMGATIGFLIANHEIVFGLVAIFFGVVGAALLWGPLRRLIPLVIVAGGAALALVVIVPKRTRPLPEIPWQSPSAQQQNDFYNSLLTHPLIIMLAVLAVVTIAAALLILTVRRDPARASEGWVYRVFGDPEPGSVAAAARAAWLDQAGVSWAVVAGLVIFAFL
ncbi:MAG: TIGR03663 family protein, partial [Thermomicrobiales bacterium]